MSDYQPVVVRFKDTKSLESFRRKWDSMFDEDLKSAAKQNGLVLTFNPDRYGPEDIHDCALQSIEVDGWEIMSESEGVKNQNPSRGKLQAPEQVISSNIYGSPTPHYVVKDQSGKVVDTFSNFNDAYGFFKAANDKMKTEDAYEAFSRDLEPHEHEDTYEALVHEDGFTPTTSEAPWKDTMKGGKADRKEPTDFDSEQLKVGKRVEMEHTSDPKKALEIAMDHLSEDPDYYRKLQKVEKESAWAQLESSDGLWESAYEAVDEAGEDDGDDALLGRLAASSPGGTDPKGVGGKSRYRPQDPGGKIPHEFQDYDGPVHPHLQQARDDLKKGLGWSVDQIRKAVPNLDRFSGKPGSVSAPKQTGTGGVPDFMPGPGGFLHATGNAKDADDTSRKAAPGERNPDTHEPLHPGKQDPGAKGTRPTQIGPAGRSGLTSFPKGPGTKAAMPRGATQTSGQGGYWELARLTKELEGIPGMPSDKAMQRLQTVSNDLHRLKGSLKKNPQNDPELEKAAKGVEAALQGIPGIMKAAGTLAKSTGTDKGLWQTKTDFDPVFGPDPRKPAAGQDPKKFDIQRWAPTKRITHPVGQDVKRAMTKADKEKQATAVQKKGVQQRIQPKIYSRDPTAKDPEKKGGPAPSTAVGFSKKPGEKSTTPEPVRPKADMSRVAPQVRKAADKPKDDEPKLAKGGEEHPANKGGEEKSTPWRALQRAFGFGKDEPKKDDKKEPEKKDDDKKDKKESAWDQVSALLG